MNRKLISKAVALLREEANGIRESCQGGIPQRDWACENCATRFPGGCPARTRFNEFNAVADKLDRYMYARHAQRSLKGRS